MYTRRGAIPSFFSMFSRFFFKKTQGIFALFFFGAATYRRYLMAVSGYVKEESLYSSALLAFAFSQFCAWLCTYSVLAKRAALCITSPLKVFFEEGPYFLSLCNLLPFACKHYRDNLKGGSYLGLIQGFIMVLS